MFYWRKSQFREKNPVLPIEKFTFLVLAKNTIMLQHLIHFSRHYLSSGRLWEVKNKQKFQTKVIIVNHKKELSFHNWEGENSWPASKTRFCWMVLLKTTTNWLLSTKRHVTCHITCQKHRFYFKMLRMFKSNLMLNLVPLSFNYVFGNITNKLFLPVIKSLS